MIGETLELLKAIKNWTRFFYYADADADEVEQEPTMEAYCLTCVPHETMLEKMCAAGYTEEYIPLTVLEDDGESIILTSYDRCGIIYGVQSMTIGEDHPLTGNCDCIVFNCLDGKRHMVLAECGM